MRNRLIFHPDIFRCSCRECMTGYFAWCDSAPSTTHDASRWDRYDNPSIKDAATARGYITNSDLLACGFSVNELRDPPRCTEPKTVESIAPAGVRF